MPPSQSPACSAPVAFKISSLDLGKNCSDRPKFLPLDKEKRHSFNQQLWLLCGHTSPRGVSRAHTNPPPKACRMRQLLLNVFPKGAMRGDHATHHGMILVPPLGKRASHLFHKMPSTQSTGPSLLISLPPTAFSARESGLLSASVTFLSSPHPSSPDRS